MEASTVDGTPLSMVAEQATGAGGQGIRSIGLEGTDAGARILRYSFGF